MQDEHYLVPLQLSGSQKDISYSFTAETIDDADDIFIDAKQGLLNVNGWKQYTDIPFLLTDASGKPAHRSARKGDHISTDVPEAGHATMTIDRIEYDDYPDDNMETFSMHVAPPSTHKDDASATFVIERKGSLLTVLYHARNECDTSAAGKWATIPDAKWQSLLKGFLA